MEREEDLEEVGDVARDILLRRALREGNLPLEALVERARAGNRIARDLLEELGHGESSHAAG